MQAARLLARLQREITMLKTDPPPGVCAWPHNDMLTHLEAQLQGPANTVYSRGLFKLDVQVPERYPFEPPSVRFVTPIYHPNIDSGGRICLDILNMPPKGAWKPSLNILTVLVSIGSLLSEPNPDDGLMGDITAEYKHHRTSFDRKARQMTEQYALPSLLHDTSHQNKTTTSSIPKVSSLTPSSEANCGTKLLPPGGEHPESGDQASSSDKCKMSGVVAGPSPLKQRLALGRKLSLTKSEQPSADINIKDPSPTRSLKLEGHAKLPRLAANRRGQAEDNLQPEQQKTALDCKATSEVQRMDTSVPRSEQAILIPKPDRDETSKPSRLSLLSRLKTSRPRLSQQKGVSSNTEPALGVIQEANCSIVSDCIIVSDSESDDDEVPVYRGRLPMTHSRLSLTQNKLSLPQRGYAGKRKASLR